MIEDSRQKVESEEQFAIFTLHDCENASKNECWETAHCSLD
jgi:hypothetical protein